MTQLSNSPACLASIGLMGNGFNVTVTLATARSSRLDLYQNRPPRIYVGFLYTLLSVGCGRILAPMRLISAEAIIYESGPIGAWVVNVTTGVTKPTLGSAENPEANMNSVNVSAGAGTLTIMFSDNDFTGTGQVTHTLGGTTAGSVDYEKQTFGTLHGPRLQALCLDTRSG
jgi:hypothetical protein